MGIYELIRKKYPDPRLIHCWGDTIDGGKRCLIHPQEYIPPMRKIGMLDQWVTSES